MRTSLGFIVIVCWHSLHFKLPDAPAIEIRPDVGTALAAGGAGEPIFAIGRPNIVRPLIGADPDPVRALVVGAVDQQAAHA